MLDNVIENFHNFICSINSFSDDLSDNLILFPYTFTENTSSFNHTNAYTPELSQLNLNEEDEDGLKRFISLQEIYNFLNKILGEEEIKNIFNNSKNLENKQHYNFMKNKKNFIKKKNLNEDIKYNIKKRGRKTNKTKNKIHNKESPDNILRKIKNRLFKYIWIFLNKILNLEGDKKLAKLNYVKNISSLQREREINCLDMKLKDIFSSDISEKYKKRPKDYNKKIIEDIINEIPKNENELKEYKTKIFSLNITYRDFINLFMKKINISYLVQQNEESELIDIDLINNSLYDIKYFIREEKNKHQNDYFCSLLFYLFNIERYYNLKQKRKQKKKEIKENKK